MSDHSIEHSIVFNTARRVLKFVAPEYRAVATELLEPGQSLLDIRKRTVEVPEGDAYKAAGMIVFHAGFLKHARLNAVADNVSLGETGVIEELNDEDATLYTAGFHRDVDSLAFNWARQMMVAYYPELEVEEAVRLVDQRQSFEEWLSYFKGNSRRA